MSTADLYGSEMSNPVRRLTGQFWNNLNSSSRRAIFFGSALLLLVDLFRYAVVNSRYQVAFTDGFEAVVAATGVIACIIAARQSMKLTRALWAAIAVYLALNVAADAHDLLIDLGWHRAQVHPLESIGWCVYLPLALLIFFPLAEEGHLRWKWLPVIDFTQVGIAIGIAYFRYIYLQHLAIGQNWTEFGFPEYVRNVLIASGLLLRSRFEPFAPAKRIYRVVGGAFAVITISKAVMPAYDAIPPVLVRHMAMLCLGVYAAAWNDGPIGVPAGKRRREIHGLLTIFAATTFAAVMMIADDGPVAFDGIIDAFAGISLLLFVARTVVADSERKHAAVAARASEKSYRTLFEKSVAGVAITRWDGLIVDCNDAWARIFGHTEAMDCRGSDASSCYRDPGERQAFLDAMRESGSRLNLEMDLRRKDGSPLCVLASCVLLPQGVGEPLIQSTIFDITDRKLSLLALQRKEEDYRSFVSQSSEGIFRQDLDTPLRVDLPEDELAMQILHGSYLAECNEAIVKMHKLDSAQDFIGRRLTEFVTPEDPRNVEMVREYVRSGFRILERESHETDILGNPRVFRNSMIGIVEDGKLVRTWGIQRDVTEQTKLEDERRNALQALSKSEERFRVALKDSPITVFHQDCDLRYTWVYNSQIYKQEEVLGKTDVELMGARAAASLIALKQKVLKTGKAFREEISIPKNGTTYYFDTMIEPLRDAQGTIVGITGASMDVARLRLLVDRLQSARDKLAQEKSYLEDEIEAELGFEEVIGQSSLLREGLQAARTVAPTDSTVLILGETGTGKELVARSIHALSSRKGRTFVKLNCAAVPSGLLESELFGHEKGAYTSAVSQKVGRIELADKGTLFLDEIGELPLELQPKLLRVLQDREFERLGGIHTIHVDVRIIAATNRDLQLDVTEKRFRDDLFYRLSVFPIHLPALRERRGDVPLLVQNFVQKHSTRMGKHIEIIPDETMRVLERWNWPGNIRELENAIERMVIMSKGSELAPPPAELEHPEDSSLDSLTEMERDHIIRILRETNGVISGNDGAANRLGVKRTTLQSMLKRFNIQANEYRRGPYSY